MNPEEAEKYRESLVNLQDYVVQNAGRFQRRKKTEEIVKEIVSKINFLDLKKLASEGKGEGSISGKFKFFCSKKNVFFAEKVLGKGRNAVVYKVQSLWDGPKGALKVRFSENYGLEQQKIESDLLREIHGDHPHPSIVRPACQVTLPIPDQEDRVGLLQPLADGDLSTVSREFDPFQVAADLCSALHRLHSLNISHNDIKPENIFIKDGCIQLADFDEARKIEEGDLAPYEMPLETIFINDLMQAIEIFSYTAGNRDFLPIKASLDDYARSYTKEIFYLSIHKPTFMQNIFIKKLMNNLGISYKKAIEIFSDQLNIFREKKEGSAPQFTNKVFAEIKKEFIDDLEKIYEVKEQYQKAIGIAQENMYFSKMKQKFEKKFPKEISRKEAIEEIQSQLEKIEDIPIQKKLEEVLENVQTGNSVDEEIKSLFAFCDEQKQPISYLKAEELLEVVREVQQVFAV